MDDEEAVQTAKLQMEEHALFDAARGVPHPGVEPCFTHPRNEQEGHCSQDNQQYNGCSADSTCEVLSRDDRDRFGGSVHAIFIRHDFASSIVCGARR